MWPRMVHFKCRNAIYPLSEIRRFPVSDDKVAWNVAFEAYKPPEYEAPVLKNKPWADPVIGTAGFRPKFNQLDGNINRESHQGAYAIKDGRPQNPGGRTGLLGRGLLGRWGPNHAADPIVTRWNKSNKRLLQFCAIQRHDCGQWAIPGGMVDPGELISETLRREFSEEALDGVQNQSALIQNFFKNGTEVYRGYVDDPRNTDNAWMETVAFNFHDEHNQFVGNLELRAGDDAKNVKWIDVSRDLNLYASHINFLEAVAKLHNAIW